MKEVTRVAGNNGTIIMSWDGEAAQIKKIQDNKRIV